MRKIIAALGLILLMALFFVGLVLTNDQSAEERQIAESQPAIGTAQGNDLDALMDVFGCPVPYGSKTGVGRVTDAEIGTLRARLLTWQGDDGVITQAVIPPQAASLLRREGFPLDENNLWNLGTLTLMLSTDGSGVCAYYQTEDAAYSLYQANTGPEAFLTHLATLFPTD
ncbi:MAG: hypothetical protein IJ664_03625 [Clostridia bacterium]|nr:hypothetical protein [Clostridia bacterium]